MMKLCLILLIFSFNGLTADSTASIGIDRAIEYSQAARYDLAAQALSKLLSTNLQPIEKATVLYNLAITQEMQNDISSALAALNQIDPEVFEDIVKQSPLLAASISYNGVLYAVRYAKLEIASFVKNHDYKESGLASVAGLLAVARSYFARFDQLLNKNIVPQDVNEPVVLRAYLMEEMARLKSSLQDLFLVYKLEQKSKTQAIDAVEDMLQSQFFESSELFQAQSMDASHFKPYYESYDKVQRKHLRLYLSRITTFLSAPAKKQQAAINVFFAKQLGVLENDLARAVMQENREQFLSSLYTLMSTISVLQGQVLHKDIQVLLDERAAVAARYALDNQSPFWLEEWKEIVSFSNDYLNLRERGDDNFENALLKALQRHLNSDPDLDHCLQVAKYWEVLSTSEAETFPMLVKMLHGAKTVDFAKVKQLLEPLLDRMQAAKIPNAVKPLQRALKETKSTSCILLYQDVMEAWFFADPEKALSFLFQASVSGINSIQTKQATSYEAFIAHADMQLLLHILDLLINKDGASVISLVLKDLNRQLSWFSDKQRGDFAFYTISLELDWLQVALLVRCSNLEEITKTVDFEVILQKKIIALNKFKNDKEYSSSMELFSSMQTQLAVQASKGLSQIKPQGPKLKLADELLKQAIQLAPNQAKDAIVLAQVYTLLEKASEILHSLQAEAESNKESNAEKQKMSEAPEVPKKALNLSADTSIRLLQEMQREDQGLEKRATTTGQPNSLRPW